MHVRDFRRMLIPLCAAGLVAAAGLLMALSGAGGAVPGKSARLVVLYSNQAYGQIRSCNCTKFRYGGYGRELTLVEQVRKETPNVVIIEGGDAVGQKEADQDRLKSEVTVQAMGMIGYTAFVPGDAELRFDRRNIDGWTSKSKTPFILANAKFKDTGKPVCSRPFVVQKLPSGLRVAVIGVVGSDLFPDMMQMGLEVEITSPEAALKSLLPKVRPQADLVVVVAHASAEKAKVMAKTPGIDMLLCTHSFEKLSMPAKDKNIVEASTEKIGKCLFVLSNSRSGWSVGRLDLELDGKAIKSARNRMFFLDRAYNEHPSMVKIYDKYNTDVATMLAAQQNEMKAKFAALLKDRGIDPSKRRREKVFAGSEACKACHADSFDAWAKSRHAAAFASLEKTGQGTDPECIRCHVTGASVRNGFVSTKETPDLINVQCEACHGSAVSHVAKPSAGFGAVSEELCRGCHTEAYNPDFDFEQMVGKIRHGKKQ